MSQSEYQESLSKGVLKNLVDMHQRTTHCYEFDRMKRLISPFLDHFGLNHFYYVKIFSSGHYTTLGFHTQLHECAFDDPKIISSSPCIRHPESVKPGIFIYDNNMDQDFKNTSKISIDKFKVKFTIDIRRKQKDEVEFYGFGTKYLNKRIAENLINEMNIVFKFIDFFTIENKKLIQASHENRVNVIPLIGSRFYQREEGVLDLPDKFALLRHMGLETPESLTVREMEILQYFAFGYPAKYIASKLFISVRTVENYIATLKLKLNCENKIELIDFAKNIFNKYT